MQGDIHLLVPWRPGAFAGQQVRHHFASVDSPLFPAAQKALRRVGRVRKDRIALRQAAHVGNMIVPHLLIAEIRAQDWNRVVKHGSHAKMARSGVGADVLKPRLDHGLRHEEPRIVATIFGQRLIQSDALVTAWRQPVFAGQDRAVELAQLPVLLPRRQHVAPRRGLPDDKQRIGVRLEGPPDAARQPNHSGIGGIYGGVADIDHQAHPGVEPAGEQLLILLHHPVPPEPMAEALQCLRLNISRESFTGENRHRLPNHFGEIGAQKPRVQNHFGVSRQVKGQSRLVKPLHFRQRQIEPFPAGKRNAQVGLAHDPGQFRIVRKAQRMHGILQIGRDLHVCLGENRQDSGGNLLADRAEQPERFIRVLVASGFPTAQRQNHFPAGRFEAGYHG